MKNLVLYCSGTNSVGVRVIVENLTKALSGDYNVSVSDANQEFKKDDVIIPYGLDCTYKAIKNKCNVPVSLMVDYYSLSQWNSILYFWRRKDFWTSMYSIKTILRCLKYYLMERYVFTRCKNFMFVSQVDIDNIKKRYPDNNYFCVPNGVNIPKGIVCNSEKNRLCFGFLSIWIEESFFEHKWFVDLYWPYVVKKYPNATLKICGRFASDKIKKYFSSKKNVEFIGEVESLSGFFNAIDVYLVPIPKGCGILNKVLDAFAHKTLVAGISPSFSGFSYMKNSFVECNSLQDYLDFIESYIKDKSQYDYYISNAYENIKVHNNWQVNYKNFVNNLIKQDIL